MARTASSRISVQAAGTTLAELHASFQGTRKELAATLGLSERTLYRKLKELGLD
ncbi:helix-turn-helix domain-containing protein [Pseudoduganella danionis]|uniref:helix-turn-helix domain-containing protein n=1 Tax=Pseudoduganella danionis TaxID=1890295 RepID=UPI0035B1B15C